jgi:hypothetical protein
MSKQTLAVIVGAIALFAIAVFGALAFTGGDSSSGNGHTMPGGSTMTDQMSTTDGTMSGMDMP